MPAQSHHQKRNQLQARWQKPQDRFNNFGNAVIEISIEGIRCHQDTKVELRSPITAFCGLNGTGKSTVIQVAASAYRPPGNKLGGYRLSNFIIKGKLDPEPYRPNSSVRFMYASGATTGGGALSNVNTVSYRQKRWSGYHRQPERHVYFAGVGLYLPRIEEWNAASHFAQNMNIATTSPINPVVRDEVARILGVNYSSADENETKYGKRPQRVVQVARGASKYSDLNMGCGEGRIHHIVGVLEKLPEKSLVVLEEPETSLHPAAEYRFGEYLVDVCLRRGHQVFLTTHSEHLLRALHSESRVLLYRTATSLEHVHGISVAQATSMMAEGHVTALRIVVEDDVAEAIVREVLRRNDFEFLKSVEIVPGGSAQEIKPAFKFFASHGLRVCAVLDGDMGGDPASNVFTLFGTTPPEQEIIQSPSVATWFSDTYQIDWAVAEAAFVGKDHHSYFRELERLAADPRAVLISGAVRAYLNDVPETDQKGLVELLKQAVT